LSVNFFFAAKLDLPLFRYSDQRQFLVSVILTNVSFLFPLFWPMLATRKNVMVITAHDVDVHEYVSK